MAGKLDALRAVARGFGRALADPRLLARLAVPSHADRARQHEAECVRLLGGVPRTVPVERIVGGGGRLEAFSFLDDTSTVLDLLVLRGLMACRPGGRYFEIGTFRGESALAVADIACEVVTLSLPDSQLTARSAHRSWVAAHRTFSEGHPRIRHVFADSATFDTAPYEGWADVLFIDGDHSRQAVEADTRRYWRVRRPRTGAVVWHDAFLTPLLPRWEVLAGIAAGVPPECRRELVHVSNTLCVAWLPNAAAFPTVELSYTPRLAFAVDVSVVPAWRSARTRPGGPDGTSDPAGAAAGPGECHATPGGDADGAGSARAGDTATPCDAR
jgi:hypothetical protein